MKKWGKSQGVDFSCSGERLFAVEDVITTGKSVKESIGVVRALGAEVVGVGSLMDRSNGQAASVFDVPLRPLVASQWKVGKRRTAPSAKSGDPPRSARVPAPSFRVFLDRNGTAKTGFTTEPRSSRRRKAKVPELRFLRVSGLRGGIRF